MTRKQDVVLDTSVLINFAKVGRLDLLGAHPSYSFVVTDHVRSEISEHYSEQFKAVDAAIKQGILRELAVNRPEELTDFGKLTTLRTLGIGECSAISVAKNRSLPLAIDDNQARKKAKRFHARLVLLSTEELVVSMIQESVLTIEEADRIKLDWEANHRFKLVFGSFSEKI
jgi:predicted nucleic acid-binding protein